MSFNALRRQFLGRLGGALALVVGLVKTRRSDASGLTDADFDVDVKLSGRTPAVGRAKLADSDGDDCRSDDCTGSCPGKSCEATCGSTCPNTCGDTCAATCPNTCPQSCQGTCGGASCSPTSCGSTCGWDSCGHPPPPPSPDDK